MCKAPSCVWLGLGLRHIENRARYMALVTGLLGAFLASGSGFGERVRGAPGARRSGLWAVYSNITWVINIYLYTQYI